MFDVILIWCFLEKCSCSAASRFNSGVQSEGGISLYTGFTCFGVYFTDKVRCLVEFMFHFCKLFLFDGVAFN